MPGEKKRLTRLLVLSLVLALLLSSPAAAAVSGFVAKGPYGELYEYSYGDLIDSYALKIIGLSNGLYEDFSAKITHALVNSSGDYIDYNDVIDHYASSVILNQAFDLTEYINGGKAKKAQMPVTFNLVKISSGKLISTAKTLSSSTRESLPDVQPPNTKTPIIGQAEVTLEQARLWAGSRKAHQRFIDIAPLYWEFGKITGIRPEVLYAQAAVETDFGHYTNLVPPSFNNWAGIKIADADEAAVENHQVFTSPEEGVRAHFNHMAAYVGLVPVGEPHGRYYLAMGRNWAGMVTYVEELSGRWTPLPDYHSYILNLLDQMNGIEISGGAIPEAEAKEPKTEPEPEPASGIVESPAERKVAVSVDVLRLRDGPGTEFAIIDRLIMGTVLKVTGNRDEWLKVITPEGKNGWVHGDYVIEIAVSGEAFGGKIIVIDPGHGGSDPGAVSINGLQEKTVNLAVARILKALLEEAGAKVVMTRTGDQSVSNLQRVAIANQAGADLYISIHANAFSSSESNGTETHYCPLNSHSSASRYLAHQVQGELISALGLRDRGVKANSYYILKNTEMPAALVEMAFITNPAEEEILKSAEMQFEAAQALFRGLASYLLKHR